MRIVLRYLDPRAAAAVVTELYPAILRQALLDELAESLGNLGRVLAGDRSVDSVGLGNVDGRLRTVYGDEYGLVVETAPGAGTKVVVRVPKFAPGVHA